MRIMIEFETDKGERFWATCDDMSACISAAKSEFPSERLTVRTLEVVK